MAVGHKTVAPGQTIASDWGNTVWNQSVQRFANAQDRASQYGSPTQGDVTWLEDAKRLDVFDGSAWRAIAVGLQNARMLQSGVFVVSTNSAGGYAINFPVPFPSGTTPFCQLTDGDASASSLVVHGVLNSATAVSVQGVARNAANNNAPLNGLTRVNYIAMA